MPTPAIVAPIEFSMRASDYAALGGHMDRVRALADVLANERYRLDRWDALNPWPIVSQASNDGSSSGTP